MNPVEEIESAVSLLSEEELSQFANWFESFITKQRDIHPDAEILNLHADELNKEAEDVLSFQVLQ